MEKPRIFLLTVVSPALQTEHSEIEKAVQYHSDGDFVEVFKQAHGAKAAGKEIPFVIAYMFSTTKAPSAMSFGLLTRDRYFLVEVGQISWVDGFSTARVWLDRHRGK